MMEEVMERVDLIVSVQGTRQISRENLEFLFAKYELPEADREQVLACCSDRGIRIFSELGEEPVRRAEAGQRSADRAEAVPGAGAAGPAGERRGGLLSRLLGRR